MFNIMGHTRLTFTSTFSLLWGEKYGPHKMLGHPTFINLINLIVVIGFFTYCQRALVRGQVVRAHMKEIRQLYAELVNEIDGSDMEIVWSRGLLSCPLVRKMKKVDAKMENIHQNKDHSNTPSYQFDSSRKIKASNPSDSTVNVTTKTNVSDMQFKKPDMISAEVQTDTFSSEKTRPGNISSIDKECPGKMLQELKANAATALGQQITCSSLQTDISLHKSSTLVDVVTQISNYGDIRQQDQFKNHPSNEKTEDLFKKPLSLGSGLPASDDILLPKKLVCLTSQSGEILDSEFDENSLDVPGAGQFGNGVRDSDICLVSHESDKLDNRATDSDMNFKKLNKGLVITEMDDAKVRTEQGTKGLVDMPGYVKTTVLPVDQDQLLKLKDTVALELLWVLQAINSRKNYLRLKEQMQ